MQTRMVTHKITMKQNGQAYFSFYIHETTEEEISGNNLDLKTLGVILKSLNSPVREMIVLARLKNQGKLTDSYNLFLQCDNYISIHNRVTVPISHTAAALTNTLKNLVSSEPAPKLTIDREVVNNKHILEVDVDLIKAIFNSTVIGSVAFKPSRTVARVGPLGERTLTKDKVNEALNDNGGEDYIARQGDVQATFEKNRLARLSYYIPILQRLTDADTKVLVVDRTEGHKDTLNNNIATLNTYSLNLEANKEAAGLPDNNVWANFKKTVSTHIKTLTSLKAKLDLKADLQAFFTALESRLRANTNKAALDSQLIQSIKDNFIRSMQLTAATFWCELQKNTIRAKGDRAALERVRAERATLEKFLEIFHADIVDSDNQNLEYIAFNSNYGSNSFSAIAQDINSLPPSTLKKDLLETFRKENPPKHNCFVVEKEILKWTSYVTDANNPEALAKEEESVKALVEEFYKTCHQKISDTSTAAREIITAVAQNFSDVRKILPRIKDIYAELQAAVKKNDEQLAEYNTIISKFQKPVSDQQRNGLNHYLDIYKPNALLTELKNISSQALASKNALLVVLHKIGTATTIEEANSARSAAEPELKELKDFKANFDLKKQELDKAIIEGDKQIQTKRIDDLMRENFLRLSVALFDVKFLHENTTQFLCLGGTTVSLLDGEAIKVPRGSSEMITEFLKCGDCKNIATIDTKTVMDTLAAVKLIAQAALKRSDTRLFKKVRKEPMQKFYEQVASLNLNIGELSNLAPDKFVAINLTPVNGNWPTQFENHAYKQDQFKKTQFEEFKARRRSNISSETRVDASISSSMSMPANESSVSVSVRSSRRRSSFRP
jgi:hypothetical protein